MSDSIEEARQRHQRELLEIQRRESLTAETDAVTSAAWARIRNGVQLNSDRAAELMPKFIGGSADLGAYRIVELPGTPAPLPADLHGRPSHFQHTIPATGQGRTVLHVTEPTPEGGRDGQTLAEIRQQALSQRARANANAAAPVTLDPNAGASEAGHADVARGAELRPLPVSEEQQFQLALAEIPELLDDAFSETDVATLTDYVRQHQARPDLLARFGAVLRIVAGPDGEPIRWAGLHTWTPESPYPDAKQEPGTRVLHARRLLAMARDRANTRVRYGGEVAQLAVRSPFRRGLD